MKVPNKINPDFSIMLKFLKLDMTTIIILDEKQSIKKFY